MSPYYQSLRKLVGHELLMMPAVAMVVHNEKGELLLQAKSDGSWSLPAGAIEPGETPEQASARELLEETGLVASHFETLGVFGGSDFQFTYPNADQVEYTVVLSKCHDVSQVTTTLDPETVRLQYFTQENAPDLALPYPAHLLYKT